jgi:hypothetical protein
MELHVISSSTPWTSSRCGDIILSTYGVSTFTNVIIANVTFGDHLFRTISIDGFAISKVAFVME